MASADPAGPARPASPDDPVRSCTNAEIAAKLRALGQLLSARHENPFKVRAYRRAADTIENLGESVADLVRSGGNLTAYSGIGPAIAGAIGEIVATGTFRQLETMRTHVPPEVAALSEHPALDPQRVLRIYRKLKISSVAELKKKLQAGEIGTVLGARMEQHVRGALTGTQEILLHDADRIAASVVRFLLTKCAAKRAELTGDIRRRVEVIHDISVLVETVDFAETVSAFERFGGGSEQLSATTTDAMFKLAAGITITLHASTRRRWGWDLLLFTGSEAHLAKLTAGRRTLDALGRGRMQLSTETAVYRQLGLSFIEPELREGLDEIGLAKGGRLPALVTVHDIRGELHAHSTSSDGAHSIEEMRAAALERGYEYLGITDHSQSLRIAGGVSVDDLWKQIRLIDRLNADGRDFRILKSAEVDILADGTLDYPDDLLRELDYTVCSIHSRFALTRAAQTERILRAMDHPHFTILGHATGRLLLRRPGYELDIERIIARAKQRGCFFEINASPDRLDLSAAHARRAREAGVKVAISTDAHSTTELDHVRSGLDQARRAGFSKDDVLNCMPWPVLQKAIARR